MGNAHGAVHKHFQVRLDVLVDLGNFRNGQFPGQNHPIRPQVFPGLGGGRVGDVGLGADVELHLALVHGFPGNGPDPQVGNQKAVHLGVIQVLQVLGQPRQVLIVGHDVHGDVHLPPQLVGEGRHFPDFLQRKIGRECSQAKGFTAQIDGICPVEQCYFSFFQAPGRSQ